MKRVPSIVVLITLAAALLVGWPLLMAGAASHNHGASPSTEGHGAAAPSTGSGAVCEVCQKPLVASSQVDLKATGDAKEHHYRCIHCALVAASDRVKSDVTLRTHSAGEGKAVTWTRRQGRWQVSPASAEVLALPEAQGECLQGHLVFGNSSEFQAYRKTHSSVGAHKPLGATQVAAILAAGKEPAPKEATCPVSGRKFQPTANTEWTVYQGKTYYFCCAQCKPRFGNQPAAYASGHGPKPQHAMGKGGCGGHQGGGCGSEAGGSCSGHKPAGAAKSAPADSPQSGGGQSHPKGAARASGHRA